MTRAAVGWLFLALWACMAAGCALLPVGNLDPGPSSDPNADPGQECERRIRSGMPVAQAFDILREVAPHAKWQGSRTDTYGSGQILEWRRLDKTRTIVLFHDSVTVSRVLIDRYLGDD